MPEDRVDELMGHDLAEAKRRHASLVERIADFSAAWERFRETTVPVEVRLESEAQRRRRTLGARPAPPAQYRVG